MVRDLPAHLSAAAPAAVAVLESVRRYLWHGNVGRALIFVEDFTDGFDLIADPPPEARKLRQYLEEFSRYIDNNADLIPNYAERYRYGEVVSTAFIGSTVNQVIAKRFAKKQPDAMDAARRPSPHVTANPGLDDALDNDFKRWREGTAET